jgi:hypothetical protein
MTAHETSLSKLSDHDWNVLRSRWHRGIDWNVKRLGHGWEIIGDLGRGFPIFPTKTMAYNAGEALILAESLRRAALKEGT